MERDFFDILKIEIDEDSSYIITDYETIVYGYGDTVWEALLDYIISLIEYSGLLLEKTRGNLKEDKNVD